jgi:hypothetical protein
MTGLADPVTNPELPVGRRTWREMVFVILEFERQEKGFPG